MCRAQSDKLSALEHTGYAVVPDVLTRAKVNRLLQATEAYCTSAEEQTGRTVHAIRNLFDTIPAVTELACSDAVRGLIEPALGPDAFAVRAIYFDKPPGSNWKVAWHQDQAIAVKARIDVDGYGPWSMKEDVHHVEPPVSVLEQMLTVRIHLDDCDEQNGPLRVIPGTHRMGRLMTEDAARLKTKLGEVTCTAPAGAAVLMRPSLLHASSPATIPTHRRVIHIESASCKLPDGLEWAFKIKP